MKKVSLVLAFLILSACIATPQPQTLPPHTLEKGEGITIEGNDCTLLTTHNEARLLVYCYADAPATSTPPAVTDTPGPTNTPEPTETPTPPTATPTAATNTPTPPTATPTATPTPTVLPTDAYHVSPDGSDSNPGTEARPFRTLTRGVSVLMPGDTLFVREGTYHETLVISTRGTATAPVTITAYPGEHPILDGRDILPGDYYRHLITLRGNYVTINGFEISNINGTAIQMSGSHNIVSNNKIHHCLNKAVLIGGTGYCDSGVTNTGNLVEDNEVWMTSLIHENIQYGGRWAGAISAARCPSHTTIRRNTVYETWGIGIQVYEGYDTVIEDNVTWDNQLEHFYVNNAPRTLVQRNMAYNTPDSIFLYKNAPSTTYAFCDETAFPVTKDVTIINNLSLGGNRGFYFYNQQAGSGLKNFLIANNTFADSKTTSIQINAGDHSGSHIYNNVFSESGSLAIVAQVTGLDFDYNLWSATPPTNVSGNNDVIGDPHLTLGSAEAGQLLPESFSPLTHSPAIDAGFTILDVPHDYDRTPRPQSTSYDMGAHEQ